MNATRIDDSETILSELREQNKGIVLIQASAGPPCSALNAVLARPGADGRYVEGEQIAIKSMLNSAEGPSEVVLPAGDYAIVGFDCAAANTLRHFRSHAVDAGALFTGKGKTYDQVVATFNVRSGEFVDLGSIQLAIVSSEPQSRFTASVVPNNETILQTRRSEKPALYSHLVRRPMIVPGQAKQAGTLTSRTGPDQARLPKSSAGAPEGKQ